MRLTHFTCKKAWAEEQGVKGWVAESTVKVRASFQASSFISQDKRVIRKVGGFPGGTQVAKNPPANAGGVGSIPGLGRSPGEGHSNPLQYSCPENTMDRGAWWATVHGVIKSLTRLSDDSHNRVSVSFCFLSHFYFFLRCSKSLMITGLP